MYVWRHRNDRQNALLNATVATKLRGLPNRRFSHERTRQEIWWEVRRRSPPLIAFRLIVRGIPLLQSPRSECLSRYTIKVFRSHQPFLS